MYIIDWYNHMTQLTTEMDLAQEILILYQFPVKKRRWGRIVQYW